MQSIIRVSYTREQAMRYLSALDLHPVYSEKRDEITSDVFIFSTQHNMCDAITLDELVFKRLFDLQD